MRSPLFLLTFALFVSLTHAQEQERKMMDRVMRPNMSLSNPAQNRKFLAVGGASIDRKFVARSFHSGEEKSTKPFWGLRNFFSKVFGTRKYVRTDTEAKAKVVFGSTDFATKQSSLIRTSSQAGKSSAVRDYPDNRSFLAKGTRQQQLSEQNHPLTIDEVRELLNKSK